MKLLDREVLRNKRINLFKQKIDKMIKENRRSIYRGGFLCCRPIIKANSKKAPIFSIKN